MHLNNDVIRNFVKLSVYSHICKFIDVSNVYMCDLNLSHFSVPEISPDSK